MTTIGCNSCGGIILPTDYASSVSIHRDSAVDGIGGVHISNGADVGATMCLCNECARLIHDQWKQIDWVANGI